MPSASADGQVIASGLAGSSVGFNPFKYNLMKGTKVHRGRGFASKSFKGGEQKAHLTQKKFSPSFDVRELMRILELQNQKYNAFQKYA